MNYYNEWDKGAAAWLRELIKAGLIPNGYVDDRSITDVRPSDLEGFTQCHFFCGIAGWPLALAIAGIPATVPLWTGSPPCQPFSMAGAGAGKRDSRHLAPAFLNLVAECRPHLIFGEQVAAAVTKDQWADALFIELAEEGYTCGFAVLPACSVGAPHKRDRIFFGASLLEHPGGFGWLTGRDGDNREHDRQQPIAAGQTDRLADAACENRGAGLCDREPGKIRRLEPGVGQAVSAADVADRERLQRERADSDSPRRERSDVRQAGLCDGTGVISRLADSEGKGLSHGRSGTSLAEPAANGGDGSATGANPHNSFWRDADRLFCRDGKFRPVEPGSFPLANGVPARVGRLRGYGNAIVPQTAAEFIKAFRGACGNQ